MIKSVTSHSRYQSLLNSVARALSRGLQDVQRVIEYQRVKTYWTIGSEIARAADESGGALVINENLYRRISDDVKQRLEMKLTLDTLRRSIQFSRAYPEFPKDTPLTWTHYLALMRVPQIGLRRRLERAAIRDGLSAYQIKQEILRLSTTAAREPEGETFRLPLERGEPYIYTLRPFTGLDGREDVCVDCGFKIHIPLGGVIGVRGRPLNNGKARYVQSYREDGQYSVRLAVRKRASLYTYAARVIRVLDGDTLDALIDVGFGIRVRERFRLKGINAPEVKTRGGQKARLFLEDQLVQCPIIIVRTEKAGMYGRWLGDIFTQPGTTDPYQIAAEGKLLNQMMLDRGLATKY